MVRIWGGIIPDAPTANNEEHAGGAYVAVKVGVSPSASLYETSNTVAPTFVFSDTVCDPPRLVNTTLLFKPVKNATKSVTLRKHAYKYAAI